MGKENELSTDCAETAVPEGIAFIEAASPLTRLHYFDGKFLKADALSQEQQYHRTRVQLSNQAGGWGVVNGLGIDLDGNVLIVDGGLAITPAGNFVMNVGGVKADIAELIKVAETAPPEGNADFQPCVADQQKAKGGSTVASGLQIYEITVGPIDTLCGNEPVYGKLCESACVSDSRHPYWREGLVLRLRPISLKLPSSVTPLTPTHLRNRVASAYFALEPGSSSDLLSRAGLQGDAWCGTASLYGRDEVALGLLVRDGSVAKIDSWAARRERMDAQARGYWQGRMAMRPWNVYLAQILQFQCQLSGLLHDDKVVISPADDCDSLRAALDKARKDIEVLHHKYASSAKKLAERFAGKVSKADTQWAIDEAKGSTAELSELSDSLAKLDVGSGALPSNRLLFNSGFQQLPPAGYLPIEPGKTAIAEQLQRIFGEGVRVHLRAARADALPHLLEEAQHMDRISLTRGLDNPQDLEDVEVFIPDGHVQTVAAQSQGTWWQTSLKVPSVLLLGVFESDEGGDSGMHEASPLKLQRLGSYQRFDAGTQLDGLTRTESREDGSYGLTTVVSLDLLEAQTQVIDASEVALEQAASAVLAMASGASDEAAAAPASPHQGSEEAESLRINGIVGIARDVGAYLAADMASDPFDLAIGEDTTVKLEWLSLADYGDKRIARHLSGQGTLTVLQRLTKGSQAKLVLQLDLIGTTDAYQADGSHKAFNVRNRSRLALVRQGDGRTGLLLIDDIRHDPASPAVEVEWNSSPHNAVLSLVSTETTTDETTAAPEAQAPEQTHLLINRSRLIHTGASKERDFIDRREEAISLAALPAQPDSSSATGAAALNALGHLSEFMDDAAFLARARARFFPAAKAKRSDVTAVHDWVMFRRMRPNFCCDAVAVPSGPTVEGFQVWHLKLGALKELELLLQALKKGDDAVFLKLAPKRVGVLRYQDEQAEPEESPARVLAMWKQARPGQKVALARVWETTPEAGQGWQNRTRLLGMLQQISALTTPPANGTGAIAALTQAPGPLADGSVDGGMLVVTLDQTEARLVPHRVILVPVSVAERLYKILNADPQKGWLQVQELLKGSATTVDLTTRSLIVPFDQGKLMPSDEAALKTALMEVVTAEAGSQAQVLQTALRLDATALAADVKPGPQHDVVCKALGASVFPGGKSVFQLTDTDLGGAQVVSLVFVDATPVNN